MLNAPKTQLSSESVFKFSVLTDPTKHLNFYLWWLFCFLPQCFKQYSYPSNCLQSLCTFSLSALRFRQLLLSSLCITQQSASLPRRKIHWWLLKCSWFGALMSVPSWTEPQIYTKISYSICINLKSNLCRENNPHLYSLYAGKSFNRSWTGFLLYLMWQ